MTVKANYLNLTKSNELFFTGDQVFVALGHFNLRDLASAMVAFGDDRVTAEFRTSDRYRESDTKKFERRMRSLSPFYSFSGFSQKVVNGNVFPNTFVATLQRMVP